ncbi:MAG: cell division protein ZapA [Spirochaetales bacterium]
MGTLQINILGTSFAIEAKEDNQYLEKLLSYYSTLVSEIETTAHVNDPLKIAILSGIMMCDELYKERKKADEFKTFLESRNEAGQGEEKERYEAERITLKMIKNIDRLLQ